jgi:hypothetical protein
MTTMAQICQVWVGDCHIPIIASNKYSEQYKVYFFPFNILFVITFG